ncbi:hypothetical protein TNIN_464651 [Trichonephila inaurata madagascariensis]|uniref:Uncharacterized protein n=1 Tax=Trichonephila inaurata madagascariensis TaxID=2747483 RepID=A0A8X6YI36_9ARAC|nr:hypothetical protein TNIN_464651 [Trichonephila inaurata madagascariensis]
MFIGIAMRMLSCLLAALSAGLKLKEQIFVTFAGLPKATVQAAIGPVALSLARKLKLGPEIEEYGIMILTAAVLSILITAPLGATAIALLAPRLLERDGSVREKPKREIAETMIPMYDNNSTYHSYGTKDDGKPPPSISNENAQANSVYSIAKL